MNAMIRKTCIAAALAALVGLPGFAATPKHGDEAESPNTAYYRALYFQKRHTHPPGTRIAKLRWKAYQASVARAKTPQARAIIANLAPTAPWLNIGPQTIMGGQTPTAASPQSRSNVSGRVSAIAIDPADGTNGSVYIGGALGGIWKSTDVGVTWTPLTDKLGSLGVGAIALAPNTPGAGQGTIYFGTGEGNNGYTGVGIYISHDSGATWSGPYGGPQFQGTSVDTIAIDRADAQHLLAGTVFGLDGIGHAQPTNNFNWGIYSSGDGGQTWAESTSTAAQTQIQVVAQDPNTATIWWAAATTGDAGGGGLLKSIDNGSTWTAVDGAATGLPATGADARTWISLNSNAGTTVIYYGTQEVPASQASNNKGGTLYVSTDGGANFTHLTAADGFCQGQCFYDMPIYTPAGSPSTVFTGGAGDSGAIPSSFMISTNGGTSFTDEMLATDGNSALHADMHAITTWPGDANNLWVGNDGGVFHSTDAGLHWIDSNTNLQLTQFQGCSLYPGTSPTDANAGNVYGGTQDNGTNVYLGNTVWGHSADGDGGFALIDQGNAANIVHTYYNTSNTQIYAESSNQGLATTPDGYNGAAGYLKNGNSVFLNNGINGADQVLFYAPMALDPVKTETLYFGTDHLYIAPDFFNQSIAAYNAANAGTPNPDYPVFTALNGGAALNPPISPSTDPSGPISYIYPEPSVQGGSATTIFVGTSSGLLWQSTNSGTSFTQIDTTSNLPQEYIADIITDPNNAQTVVVARSGFSGTNPTHNLRISHDGGTSWADSSTGLPDIPINAVVFDPVTAGQLWAGTDLGVYVSTDGGANWAPYNTNFPNVAVFSMASNPTTHRLLACTHGRGAFELISGNNDEIFKNGFEQ